MANNEVLTRPPLQAWLAAGGIPQEFARWFAYNWVAIVAQVAAIEGINTDVGAINGSLSLVTTNLATLQAQVTTLQGQVATLQGQVTTLQSQVAALQAQLAPGISHTVALAKLTTGGSNGSLTSTSGVVTAISDPS